MGVGLPKGYAYIEMGSEEEAQLAIDHLHEGQIDGNFIRVEFQADRKRAAAAKEAARLAMEHRKIETSRPLNRVLPGTRNERDRRETERTRHERDGNRREVDHKNRDRDRHAEKSRKD